MWLVRLGTFSRYGHACEVVGTDPGRDLPVEIIEAAPRGVRRVYVHPTAFRWSTGGPLDAHLTDEIRSNLVERAFSVIGRGYDWPSVAAFIPRFFGSKIGWSPEHPDDHLFCSELVVWNRREEGLKMFPGVAPGDVSPGMLQDFCPGTYK